jgi:hypothetical protein
LVVLASLAISSRAGGTGTRRSSRLPLTSDSSCRMASTDRSARLSANHDTATAITVASGTKTAIVSSNRRRVFCVSHGSTNTYAVSGPAIVPTAVYVRNSRHCGCAADRSVTSTSVLQVDGTFAGAGGGAVHCGFNRVMASLTVTARPEPSTTTYIGSPSSAGGRSWVRASTSRVSWPPAWLVA